MLRSRFTRGQEPQPCPHLCLCFGAPIPPPSGGQAFEFAKIPGGMSPSERPEKVRVNGPSRGASSCEHNGAIGPGDSAGRKHRGEDPRAHGTKRDRRPSSLGIRSCGHNPMRVRTQKNTNRIKQRKYLRRGIGEAVRLAGRSIIRPGHAQRRGVLTGRRGLGPASDVLPRGSLGVSPKTIGLQNSETRNLTKPNPMRPPTYLQRRNQQPCSDEFVSHI